MAAASPHSDRRPLGLILALGAAIICALVAPSFAGAATYVAMGDSYSSGTGTREYYHSGCERSVHAYPELIKSSLGGSYSMTACGGARTSDVTNNQLGPLDSATQFATISIGGNDAGFSSVITECAKPFVSCNDEIDNAQSFINNTLPGRLDDVYTQIRNRAPNAIVGVVGYPRLFNGEDCNAGTFFSGDEMNRLNQTADMLANVLRTRARNHGFSFVDARNAFLGHAVCDDPEWLNGLSNPTSESYHPNRTGHSQGYAGIVRSALQAAPQPTAPVGGNGRIAFSSNRTGNAEVFVVNRTGTFPVNLTNDPAADVDPSFSPNGTKVAFASNRDGDNEIYVMNADGSGVAKLTSNTSDDREPTWSPNGSHIAFRSDRTGNNEVFRMTASGGSQTNLTNNSASDFAPDWSPDGAEIAFQRFTSGSSTGQGNEVFKMNADGQGKSNLTNNASSINDGQPSWSPNGATVAFHSNRDGDFEIFTFGPTGGTATQRTSNTASDQQPTWAPNGTQIAFNSNRDGNDEIYTMTSTGGSQTNRTNSSGSDTGPSWQADSTAPQTTITAGPAGATNDATPAFEFSSNELGASFQCRVDGAAFASCSSPHTTQSLADGEHTFEVRSTDEAANADASPAARTFTVDTVAPETEISDGPAELGNDPSPTFRFTATEDGASFECSLDGGEWESCASPFVAESLADGEHSFAVRATDEAGNVDGTPAERAFTVDTAPPATTIDKAPAALTRDAEARFEFSSEPGATFECSVDGAEWAACASPHTTAALPDGDHSFAVRATDLAGNVEDTGPSHDFRVDTTPPDTAIDSGPDALGNENRPTFEFSSEPGASFECRLDGGEWAACESPLVTEALADGDHGFEVRATDEAGNTDPSPAEHAFTVDTTPPETAIDAGPDELSSDTTATFEFSSEPGASFECRLDGGGWEPCASPLTTDALADGEHGFEVRATDGAGNTDPSPASYEFTVDATAPVIDLECPARVLLNEEAEAVVEASDALSGLADGGDPSGRYSLDTSEVGTHTFTVEATDRAGNRTEAECEFAVRYDFELRPPVNVNGESVFKLGSTVPVKFRLADADGNPIDDAVATLDVVRVDGDVEGDSREAVSTDKATSGNHFRLTGDQYHFNLSTKGLSTGTYGLKIGLDDGAVHRVLIGLR